MKELRRIRAALPIVLALAACTDDKPVFIDAASIDAHADDGGADVRPGPVTNLTATGALAGMRLTWTNPGDADLAGILLVRTTAAAVTFAPTDGTTYGVGQAVATGETVVHVALATTATVDHVAAVEHHFAAWAYDAARQYSPIAITAGRTNLLGAQTGEIQVFLDGTVVVTRQPYALVLSGTATRDGKAETLDLQLRVENQTGRVVFNLKGLVDATSQGTVTNNVFPPNASAALPMAYYGPAGLPPGAGAPRPIGLTGIDGSVDPVVLTMHFVDAPMIIGGHSAVELIDASGSNEGASVGFPRQSCAKGQPRGAALTVDARTLYLGSKSVPRVAAVDLTTLYGATSATLTTAGGVGAVSDVALSSDGTRLYAVLHAGSHWKGGHGDGEDCNGGNELVGTAVAPGGIPLASTELVELDRATLVELRRVSLGGVSARGAIAMLAGRAVVTVEQARGDAPFQRAHVIDLATLTEVDTDAVTAGVQPLTLAGSPFEEIAVGPDRARFTIAMTDPAGIRLDTFDAATLAPTTTTITDAEAGRVVGLERDAAGRLYVLYQRRGAELAAPPIAHGGGGGNVLLQIDGATQLSFPLDPGDNDAKGLILADDAVSLVFVGFGKGQTRIRAYANATRTELDVDGDAANGVTAIEGSGQVRHHRVDLITPF